MRLNKYIASTTGVGRRSADKTIEWGRVTVNGIVANAGQQVSENDTVLVDGKKLTPLSQTTTIILNKPVGYICSRDGQGGKTIYDLLPQNLHHLKPVGRLDKNSSGLLLLTTDGQLSYELTHPKFEKLKKYKIALNKDLDQKDLKSISSIGIKLEDGVSKFDLEPINNQSKEWKVTMSQGRNRQIRRTFEALNYNVVKLHRTHFGPYELANVKIGEYKS